MTGHGMFEVSRRSFLRATLSPVLALSARAATEVGTLPLKELARAKGILYGTCISAG
jgi:hypothetical protein